MTHPTRLSLDADSHADAVAFLGTVQSQMAFVLALSRDAGEEEGERAGLASLLESWLGCLFHVQDALGIMRPPAAGGGEG